MDMNQRTNSASEIQAAMRRGRDPVRVARKLRAENEELKAEVKRLSEEKAWLLREASEYRKNAKECCQYAIVGEACLDAAIKWAQE